MFWLIVNMTRQRGVSHVCMCLEEEVNFPTHQWCLQSKSFTLHHFFLSSNCELHYLLFYFPVLGFRSLISIFYWLLIKFYVRAITTRMNEKAKDLYHISAWKGQPNVVHRWQWYWHNQWRWSIYSTKSFCSWWMSNFHYLRMQPWKHFQCMCNLWIEFCEGLPCTMDTSTHL